MVQYHYRFHAAHNALGPRTGSISKPPTVPGGTSSHTSEGTVPSPRSHPPARSGQWRVIPFSPSLGHLAPQYLIRRDCRPAAGWEGLVVAQRLVPAAGSTLTLTRMLALAPGSGSVSRPGSSSTRLPGYIPTPVPPPILFLLRRPSYLLSLHCPKQLPSPTPPRASPCPARCVPAYSSVVGATSLDSTESSMLHRKSATGPPPLHPPQLAVSRFFVGCFSFDTSTPKR
jgi:hypothetical protein